MRDHFGHLSFSPRLPDGITGLRFTVTHRDVHLHVAVETQASTYTLSAQAKNALEIKHFGAAVTLEPGSPVTLPTPALAPRQPPTQPPGRAPLKRRGTLLG